MLERITKKAHKKCHFSMPEQSLLSKWFGIITLENFYMIVCVSKQQASSSKSKITYCISSACTKGRVKYYIRNCYTVTSSILQQLPFFLVIFSASLSEVTFCSLWLTGWKRCFIYKFFMQYYNFAKFATLDGNVAIEVGNEM